MILDFSANSEIKYSLTCNNQSTTGWYFYIYQRIANQSGNDIYSVVWMVSPYKIGTQSFIIFSWDVDSCFYWLNTGKLQTGVVAYSGGLKAAALPATNCTTFDIKDDTPQLSAPLQGPSANEFSINQSANIPNGIFSTGIGMSGFATFIKQSLANTVQTFGASTTYWVAASTQPILSMQVLSQDIISNSVAITFPLNQYLLTATLAQDNTWVVQ